jgi:Tripartite tricarboxylate transporter TctB family
MVIKSQKDFFSGLMFSGVGIAFAMGVLGTKFKVIVDATAGGWLLVDTNYVVGLPARMGPGYFPLMLGIVMTILGIAIAFKAMVIETEGGDPIGRWAWRPLTYVLGANLAFGVLLGGLPSIKLPAMGLIAGIYALTIIASLADGKFALRQVLILATVLATGSYLAFIVLLKLQIPVWPTFIVG